jgi:uracil-DNA glycosylase family 4
MNRGRGTDFFIIGEEPGKTELGTGEAFSGPAGKRLMEWLKKAGLGDDREEIFQNAYFTSLCKCNVKEKRHYTAAVGRCIPFLYEQFRILSPKIVITLGSKPLNILYNYPGDLNDVVGKIFTEEELIGATLFPVFEGDYHIVPLPHPSPLSRWLNDDGNKMLLEKSIEILKGV